LESLLFGEFARAKEIIKYEYRVLLQFRWRVRMRKVVTWTRWWKQALMKVRVR